MKAQETAPLVTALAPAALLPQPVAIIGVVLCFGLLWLLSGEGKADETNSESEKPSLDPDPPTVARTRTDAPPASTPATATKRVTREDLAEALAYGERRLSRKEAASALEGLRKSAAYKAVAENGKFSTLIELTPDGLIEWKG